jgi:hypothetical protein
LPTTVLRIHDKLSQVAAFPGDGPERSALRRFHCSNFWEQMLDSVHPVSILFRLINHNNITKTFVCIHHISSATFAIVANRKDQFISADQTGITANVNRKALQTSEAIYTR